MRSSIFASETDHAAEARWRLERVVWLGAQPDSGSPFSKLPNETVHHLLDLLWRGSPFAPAGRDLDDGFSVRFPRVMSLQAVVAQLPPDEPRMLLLKLAGEVAVRPLVWLPDAASVRRKMVFAPIPDIFIESLAGSFHNNQARCERVGPVGEGERATARALYGTLAGLMQRRINLNEEHLGRYMRSATDPADPLFWAHQVTARANAD